MGCVRGVQAPASPQSLAIKQPESPYKTEVTGAAMALLGRTGSGRWFSHPLGGGQAGRSPIAGPKLAA